MLIVHDCTTCKHINNACIKNHSLFCTEHNYSNWELAEPSGVVTTTDSQKPAGNPFNVGDKVRFIDNELNKDEYPLAFTQTFIVYDKHKNLIGIKTIDDGENAIFDMALHYSRFELVEPAEPEGGEMLTIDMLSVGDRIRVKSTNGYELIDGIVPEMGKYCIRLAVSRWYCLDDISRIPITAENFPADGVVYNTYSKLVEHCIWGHYNELMADNFALPLIKERQAYLDSQKAEDDCVKAEWNLCNTCLHNDGKCGFAYRGHCNDYSQKPAGNPYHIGDKVSFIEDDSPIGIINKAETETVEDGRNHNIVLDVDGDTIVVDNFNCWCHYSRFEPAEPEVSITLTGKVKDGGKCGFYINTGFANKFIEYGSISDDDVAKVREALK